jgi:hypothetical protein
MLEVNYKQLTSVIGLAFNKNVLKLNVTRLCILTEVNLKLSTFRAVRQGTMHITTMCLRSSWYKQPQKTQAHIRQNEGELLQQVSVFNSNNSSYYNSYNTHSMLCLLNFLTVLIFAF